MPIFLSTFHRSLSGSTNFHLPFTAIAAISGGFSYLYYSSSPNLVHSDQIAQEDIKPQNIALVPDKWVEFKLQDTARVSQNTNLYRFSFDPQRSWVWKLLLAFLQGVINC
ncbi:NADH-cytochrome b-5 reductase-like protein [Trifolium repens]|nr:NADH-cytochrome b-5 reductase-like protein [Trifolium repens]